MVTKEDKTGYERRIKKTLRWKRCRRRRELQHVVGKKKWEAV